MDIQKLYEIDEQLKKSDVAALKFLCMDILGRKHLEKVKDAKDLFLKLCEKDMFEDKLFLPELLYTIGRYDLLSILHTDKSEVRRLLQNREKTKSGLSILDTSEGDVGTRSGVSAYRKLLYEISEDITDTTLQKIKFLLINLPKAKLSSATFLDVLVEMEKMERLGKDNLDELENVLKGCSKKLACKVQKFREPCEIREQDHVCNPGASYYPQEETGGHFHNLSVAEMNPPGLSVDRELVLMTDSKGALTTEESPENGNELYPMTQRPLGYCLIINNYNFEARTKLINRNGTDADKDSLTRVFQRMHFKVEVKRDLLSSDMLRVVEEFSEKDHSQMDAFVCCILSHGEKGSVLGVDGKLVLISDLLQPFAQCATLTGKPKLFFIQACQGTELQQGVWMHDGVTEQESEEDTQSSDLSSLPIEANFLIGKATVEYYKSFRHPEEGSVFIQELCRQLEIGCPKNEDILSILTKVNASVAIQSFDYRDSKQMPECHYNFTRKLVLPMD